MIHLDHPPSVSTPTTQPLALQNNDRFSWNAISTSSRDSESRALNKDTSPSVPSASIAPPFPPDKALQNTSPIHRQSSLTPPSTPRRDGEAEVASAPPTAPTSITASAPSTISQNAPTATPPNPQQDSMVENPPPSRPLTPLSELSPVPDNDEDAPLDAPGADKGEGSSSLQTATSSPSRQIPANLEATSSHIRISPSRPHPSSDHSPQRGSLSGPSGTGSSPKAELILRLNAELIKICMEFQSRAIPTDDQRYQQYASRLQSNLTWLAAAADAHHTQNRHPPLIMQPPPPIDFTSTEAVRQLYAAMPTVFARDIARAKGQLNPTQSMPTLKRERPTDGPELAIKRRDTGESKADTGMPPPATPSLAPKSVPISTQSFPGGVPQGAMPDRTRMAQMRQQQAQLQAQAPPAQQPHVSTGVRQMSPPQSSNAGVGIGAGAGAGAGVGQSQGQPQGQGQGQAAAMQQVVNNYGQQGLAFIQQLQDPNSAFVKYMAEQVPGFMTLPLQQQLESMQQAQRMIQQRRLAQQQMQQQQQFQQQQQQLQQPQQQQQQQQQLPPPPPPPPIPPQQTQQQQHNPQQQQRPNMSNPGGLAGHTPSQLQMTAQSQNSLVAGGIDPRTGGPPLTTMQIQRQLSVLSPHQRQLFLMQQQQQQQQRQQHQQQQHQQQQQQPQPSQPQQQQPQQHQQQQQLPARNSGINSNLGPSGLITQQFGGGTIPGNLPTAAALLHQRQQQARLQQQAQQQSQLGEATAFTATGPVSSNTGIPGIARSTRSPSDSAHSPHTPRGPQQQLQQLQQQQQSQSQQQPSQNMDYQRALMDAARGQVGSPAPGHGFASAQPLAGTFGAGMGTSVSTGALANTNGSYSVSPPGSAHSRTSFPGTAAAPSPSATTSGNWQAGGTTMNANGGWPGAPGAAAGMGGGIGGTMGLDPGTFAYGDTQAFGTDGLVMDPMGDPPGIEFNDIFNIPG